MIIFRVFDGDTSMHFSKEGEAFDAADKIAEDENCGPNGFVRIEKIVFAPITAKAISIMLLNGQDPPGTTETVYVRMAT